MKRKAAVYGILFILLFGLMLISEADASERVNGFADVLREKGVSPVLVSGLISMIPIFELRGGIPVGIALFRLNPIPVYAVCVVFNLIPVLPILLLLNPLMKLLAKVPLFSGFFGFLSARAGRKMQLIEKYEELGLLLFVAVPLPVTGAWTGSLVAAIMQLPVLTSFLFIALGIMTAGVVVTLLTLLGVYGIIGAAGIILAAAVLYILKMKKSLRETE